VVGRVQPAANDRAYAKCHLQRPRTTRSMPAMIAPPPRCGQQIYPRQIPAVAVCRKHLTMIDQIGEDIMKLKNRIETCRNERIRAI